MKSLSDLFNTIILTNSRNRKIDLIVNYLEKTKDPERGYAIALLTGNLKIKELSISKIKSIVKKKFDNELFDLSYDYVGDLAETISLLWESNEEGEIPKLSEIIQILNESSKNQIESSLTSWLNIMTPNERWVLIKILTGGLRIGVSSRLTKLALAKFGNKDISTIEKIWHGIQYPYLSLFLWLENRSDIPIIDLKSTFNPMMLANPIENKDFGKLKSDLFVSEWKWDGIRVQLILKDSTIKIFSRSGDNISQTFPEFRTKEKNLTVLDGELLVGKNFKPMDFNFLQQRLNRKKVSINHLRSFPGFVKLYDILFYEEKDVRYKTWNERRKILEKWFEFNANEFFDISELISFSSWKELEEIKLNKIDYNIHEGLMIKNRESPYISGRKKGYWYKWKIQPKTVDAIMMYAQRGHGKRSSFFSDFTFGLWHENKVIPICKAYFGFTDDELKIMDEYVRKNTIQKFGPVREVEKKFVVELAFDKVHKSKRHKSGVAMRFPRIKRLRFDKSYSEVVQLEQFKKEFNLK